MNFRDYDPDHYQELLNAMRENADIIEATMKDYQKYGVINDKGFTKAIAVKQLMDDALDANGIIDTEAIFANGRVCYHKMPYAEVQDDVMDWLRVLCYSMEITPNPDGTVDLNFGIKNMWSLNKPGKGE